MKQITQILSEIKRDGRSASHELLPLVYHELRRLAASKLAHEHGPGKCDATSLVHEAYLRLLGGDAPQDWDSRGHFFAAAAEAMRRILVDNARRNRRPKHGGDRKRVDLEDDCVATADAGEDLVELDDALERLAAEDPEKADVVKLRYFAGLSLEETAAALNISTSTAKRRWAYARAWLYDALTGGEASSRAEPGSSGGQIDPSRE